MSLLQLRKTLHWAGLIVVLAAGPVMPASAGAGLFAHLFPGHGTAMQNALDAGKAGQVAFFDFAAMKTFYAARDGRPVWTGDDAGLRRADAVWNYLERTWVHGLNPAQYHVTEIGALLRVNDPAQKARLELLLTDAVMHYGHDISGLRLRPSAVGQDPKYWRQPLAGQVVMQNVAASNAPALTLAAMAPQDATYRQLQAELIRLASQAARGRYDRPLDFGPGPAVPGHRYGAVNRLRQRLGIAFKGRKGHDDLYDPQLARAVMALQKENGIKPNGVINQKTLALLNRSPRPRMEQIVANMERMRWMDQQRPDRYVLVNIPQQMLWAVDKGKVAMQMAVVVGSTDRPTKAFKTDITGIRFNPHWTVPLSIKMKDFLPILRDDPTILARKGIALYKINGGKRVYLDAASVDWKKVSAADMTKMHMVQGSGDDNSLGLIRVLMPNDYNIYLHDTNHRDLFVKNERFFSSGCIRLSDPVAMARFVLADRKLWTDNDMQKIVTAGDQKDIMISRPLPIYITYITIWPEKGGRLVFGNDIYGRDRQLIDAMDAAHAYWLPVPKPQKTALLNGKPRKTAASGGRGRSDAQVAFAD